MSNNVRWEPVEGGHVVNNPARMCKLVVDNDDDAILWFLCDGLTLGGVRLRPDERLCRAKSAPPVAMPEPDWDEAPPWANWWAVEYAAGDVGLAFWFAGEPVTDYAVWVDPTNEDCKQLHGTVPLPLGADWRLSLTKRPEVTQ